MIDKLLETLIDWFSEDVKTTSSKLDLGRSYSTFVTRVQLGFYYMIFKLNSGDSLFNSWPAKDHFQWYSDTTMSVVAEAW